MAKKMNRNISDYSLDDIDRRILRELQADSRISNVELARRVQLSATPCLERVRRLERDGFIKDYITVLNPHRLEQSLLVYVEITLDRTTPDIFDRFRDTIIAHPQVLECHMVSGGFDYLIKARLRDMQAYRHFLGEGLTAAPGVRETHTYVVMEEIKESTALVIPG